MKQIMMVTLEIDKEVPIPNIVTWMNKHITGSKVTAITIQNTDLIYNGALNTYWAESTIISNEKISINEVNHLFHSHPHFIHQLEFKHLS